MLYSPGSSFQNYIHKFGIGKIILFGDKKVEKPYAGRLPYLVAKAVRR